MSNYRRQHLPGGTYFFTLNLLERRGDLLVEHIGLLRKAFKEAARVRPFEIIAIVILQDHLHCIWRLPKVIAITLHTGNILNRLSASSCRKANVFAGHV